MGPLKGDNRKKIADFIQQRLRSSENEGSEPPSRAMSVQSNGDSHAKSVRSDTPGTGAASRAMRRAEVTLFSFVK